MGHQLTETVAAIVAAHRAGTMTPAQTIARSYQRIRDHNDPAVFISLRDEKDALAEAEALAKKDAAQLPLYGVPVAVKDNIDVAGHADHRGLPGLLLYAGARFDGGRKTARGRRHHHRQDQSRPVRHRPRRRALALRHSRQSDPRRSRFRADRVRDRRSRFPPAWCRWRSAPIPRARGRVPAMLNNIVGLKPSLGLISNAGVVPACRTLDCISVFSLTVDDAMTALTAMAGSDGADPFSRDRPLGEMAAFPGQAPARRAAQRPIDLLRRQRIGESLWRGAQALDRARRHAGRVRSRAVL